MNYEIVAIEGESERSLADALATFERQFTYPLDANRRFSISHGEDYTRFIRSMGRSITLVAKQEQGVCATVSVALISLKHPSGSRQEAAYICDLKINPQFRGGILLQRLFGEVKKWLAARTDIGFCIVMDGTQRTPENYTGKVDIPIFFRVASVTLLKIPTDQCSAGGSFRTSSTSSETLMEIYEMLSSS